MEAGKGIEQSYQHSAHPYWLAFLLTGNKEVSVKILIEALDSREDLRKSIVQRALRVTSTETSGSASSSATPERMEMSWDSLKAALFHLDLTPRRILLLTVFEGYPLGEAALLLGLDVDRVVNIRAAALSEFAGLFTTMPDCEERPRHIPQSSEGRGSIKDVVSNLLRSR